MPNENAPVVPAMLTIPETAAALRVSRVTVYALMKQGKLPTVLIGRSRRVPVASIEALIASSAA